MPKEKKDKKVDVFAGLLGGMAGNAAKKLKERPTRNATARSSGNKKKKKR